MRFRSKKMTKKYRQERIPLVIAMLAEIALCQRCGKRRPDDIHEVKPRGRGGSITDPDNLVAVCRNCHEWITRNPAQAHTEGWLKHSWD